MSGALAIIKWILLMMIPYVTKSLRYAIVISLILFSGVMQFNRGDIFRISIFLALFYMINREKKLITKKNLIILFTVTALGITSFAWIGEFRQSDELNTFDIGYLMESRVDNIAFNWLYSYSAINFDVLKLVTEAEDQNFPYTVFSLFIYYFGDREFIEGLEKDRASFSLSGLNASTFLSPFVQDMGAYYIIELIVFGALMSLFIIFIKAQRLTGVYLFIMLLITLTISGNYLIVPNFVVAILLATFLGMLIKV
nr:hypothetical protein [Sporomusa silvacetica]